MFAFFHFESPISSFGFPLPKGFPPGCGWSEACGVKNWQLSNPDSTHLLIAYGVSFNFPTQNTFDVTNHPVSRHYRSCKSL